MVNKNVMRDRALKAERATYRAEMRLVKFKEAEAKFKARLAEEPDGISSKQYQYDANGGTIWILTGEVHQEDGPAIQNKRGSAWKLYGDYHRVSGPAVIRTNGHNEWWLFGIMVQSYAEFQAVTGCSNEDLVAYKLKWGKIERPRWRAGHG